MAYLALRVRQVPIITEEAIAEVRAELGLDKPYLVRYFSWLADCLRGDFGISYVNPKRTVAGELARCMPATLQLAGVSFVMVILLSLPIGFLCAVYKDGWFDKIMRAIVFMPKYVAMSSAAVVFLWILNTDGGILNYLLSLVGISKVDWLGNRHTALLSVLMLTGWRCVGYGMMVYLSAMMGISTDYYEAASLDGANAIQRFFKITIPMLSPTTLFLFVTTFLSSMKVFQSVDILTQGGPYRSTEVFVYNIYRYAMEDFRMDRASTVAIFFFLLLLVVTVATMKVSNGNVTYDS